MSALLGHAAGGSCAATTTLQRCDGHGILRCPATTQAEEVGIAKSAVGCTAKLKTPPIKVQAYFCLEFLVLPRSASGFDLPYTRCQ